MRKIVLYPFSEEMIPFLSCDSKLLGGEIISLISLKGGSIIGNSYGYKNRKLKVNEMSHEVMEKCDLMLFDNSKEYEGIGNHIVGKVVSFVQRENHLMIFDYDNEITKEIKQRIPKEKIIYIKNNDYTHLVDEFACRIYNIDTPVVFVCSLFENLNKFDIQISLRKKLIYEKFNVLQIGSRKISDLLGFYSFPSFMYSKEHTEVKKMVMFNNLLKRLETEHKPDIIIVGVPGGILPFSNKCIGDLGVTMYEITQAVRPDYVILSMPYKKYTNSELQYMESVIKIKFNIEVDCFNVVEKSALFEASESKGTVKYLTIDEKFVKDQIHELKSDNLYCLSDEKEVIRLKEDIIEKFLKYGSLTSI
ncbi:MAG: TIGR04066 family peptide maturation system protein [Eubacteriales bacterium]